MTIHYDILVLIASGPPDYVVEGSRPLGPIIEKLMTTHNDTLVLIHPISEKLMTTHNDTLVLIHPISEKLMTTHYDILVLILSN
jgi:aromatic ring-cleaving dioxygenase